MNRSLEKVEDTISNLNDRFKDGVYDTSMTSRERIEDFGDEVDGLRENA